MHEYLYTAVGIGGGRQHTAGRTPGRALHWREGGGCRIGGAGGVLRGTVREEWDLGDKLRGEQRRAPEIRLHTLHMELTPFHAAMVADADQIRA